MQIFAGAGLAITSWLLAGEVKRSGAASRKPSGKRARRRPKATAAGPKAEGAGA
jgi:hypothetical protein